MSALNGFSENAELYTQSRAHAETEDLEKSLPHLGPLEGACCLDVATGTGHTAFFFAQKLAHVFAVDINKEMLRQAEEESDRQTLSVRFLYSDCGDLNFDDETFDLVTCRLACHHFPALSSFLSEAVRVLRTEGKLLIIDNIVPDDEPTANWINGFERKRDPSHQACLSQALWSEALGEHFSILSQESHPKDLDYAAWMNRMSIPSERADDMWSSLQSAPPAAKEYLNPTEDGGKRKITLKRLILVATLK